MSKPIACVRLEGVLCPDTDPAALEEPFRGAAGSMARLKEVYDVVILSKYSAGHLAYDWLQRHQIPFTSVWIDDGLPAYDVIIDARAVQCRPATNGIPTERTFFNAINAARALCEKK